MRADKVKNEKIPTRQIGSKDGGEEWWKERGMRERRRGDIDRF